MMKTTCALLLGLLLACRGGGPPARQNDSWEKIAPLFAPPAELRGDLGTLRPVLQFYDGRPVKTPAQWKERRQEILKKWHEMLGPWPAPVEKPTITYQERVRVENFTRHKVAVQVAPDREAPAYLCVPDGAGPFPAVVSVFYEPESAVGLNPKVKPESHDFGLQLSKRGFVTLNIGQQPGLAGSPIYYPGFENAQLQPLSYLAYVAANGYNALATLPEVDPKRVGVVGHSYGGKWSLFAGAFFEKFAAVAISDPGIVFDEKRGNVNYWEPWYLGYEPGKTRGRGTINAERPRTGPYRKMVEEGFDLHELHALIAPRPFFVSGGSEDQVARWKALNHTVAVNALLGHENRVGMSNRPNHSITPEDCAKIGLFFEAFLK